MHRRLFRTLRVTIATLATFTFILLGPLAGGAAAQSVACAEQPALGVFDGNGDGVLTVGEIRAAAPDNAQLQGIASQLEAKGISGIQYAGCNGSGNGATTAGNGSNAGTTTTTAGASSNGVTTAAGGSTTGATAGGGSGNGTSTTSAGTGSSTGNGTATSGATGAGTTTGNGTSTTIPGTSIHISSLPNTGHGQLSEQGNSTLMLLLAAAGILALGGAVASRLRREASSNSPLR